MAIGWLVAGVGLLGSACATAPVVPPFPTAAPEAVGLSPERLSRVDAFIERMQREGKVAGAVTLVARHGRLVSLKGHGFADLESGRAMRTDDLFHLQSTTKPIATVAALQAMERGLLGLSDPVEKFVPPFAGMKVAVERAGAPGGFELVPAARPITILGLMTHRAGFAGLPPRDTPAARLRREADKTLPAYEDFTSEQFVSHLAALPLDARPGTEFRYGPATVVLGRAIEVVTGQPLGVALREQIFRPLGMTDRFFTVPEAKRPRVASPYARKPGQGLVRIPLDPLAPRFLSAGGNLVGTAADYLRFCQKRAAQWRRAQRCADPEPRLGRADDRRARRQLPLRFLPGRSFGLGVAIRRADRVASPPWRPRA